MFLNRVKRFGWFSFNKFCSIWKRQCLWLDLKCGPKLRTYSVLRWAVQFCWSEDEAKSRIGRVLSRWLLKKMELDCRERWVTILYFFYKKCSNLDHISAWQIGLRVASISVSNLSLLLESSLISRLLWIELRSGWSQSSYSFSAKVCKGIQKGLCSILAFESLTYYLFRCQWSRQLRRRII